MKTNYLRLLCFSIVSLGVTAVWLMWPKGNRPDALTETRAVRQTAMERPDENSSFEHGNLSPRERIAADARRSAGEISAWREKLSTGNQTTLPAEAYPSDVPVHGVSSAPSTR